MVVEIKKIVETDEDMTEEQKAESMAVFQIMAPIPALLAEELPKVNPRITGIFVMCYDAMGNIIGVSGNTAPSLTTVALQNAMKTMNQEENKFLEEAYQEGRGKSN